METELEKKRLNKIAQEERSRKRSQIVAEAEPRAEDDDRIHGGSQAQPLRTSSPSTLHIASHAPASRGPESARRAAGAAEESRMGSNESARAAGRFQPEIRENDGQTARSFPPSGQASTRRLSHGESGAARGAMEQIAPPQAGPLSWRASGRCTDAGPSMTEV